MYVPDHLQDDLRLIAETIEENREALSPHFLPATVYPLIYADGRPTEDVRALERAAHHLKEQVRTDDFAVALGFVTAANLNRVRTHTRYVVPVAGGPLRNVCRRVLRAGVRTVRRRSSRRRVHMAGNRPAAASGSPGRCADCHRWSEKYEALFEDYGDALEVATSTPATNRPQRDAAALMFAIATDDEIGIALTLRDYPAQARQLMVALGWIALALNDDTDEVIERVASLGRLLNGFYDEDGGDD